MNHSNYTLFEIIKYKIDFLECLEYTLISNTIEKSAIKNHLTYLKNALNHGMYNQIISSLFTSFASLNVPLIKFLKKYNHSNIYKITKKRKLNNYIKYNENLIEIEETLNYIINTFTEEEKIASLLDKKIIDLITLSNTHFYNFLFFNSYNLYLNCFYGDNQNLHYSDKDLKKLISIINYCNKEKNFEKYIDILKTENKIKINEQFENLSKACIQTEKKLNELLQKIIEKIANETKINNIEL